jgi:hypothetical protein
MFVHAPWQVVMDILKEIFCIERYQFFLSKVMQGRR